LAACWYVERAPGARNTLRGRDMQRKRGPAYGRNHLATRSQFNRELLRAALEKSVPGGQRRPTADLCWSRGIKRFTRFDYPTAWWPWAAPIEDLIR